MYLRDVVDRLIGREVVLKGGMSTRGVVRVGDTVRRPIKERSAFVHDLLRHLEHRDFQGAPRFLGIDEKGREILTFIPGAVPQQVGGLQQSQWIAGARLLRSLHDATVDFAQKGECDVVCHGDSGPGNTVFREGMPIAFIDFEAAHPGTREEDVGHAAWMWLHIGNRAPAQEQGANLVEFVAAYDATAAWDPLQLVLQAQHTLVKRIPRTFKWSMIRMWAERCLARTYRDRHALAAAIALRRDARSGGSVALLPE